MRWGGFDAILETVCGDAIKLNRMEGRGVGIFLGPQVGREYPNGAVGSLE